MSDVGWLFIAFMAVWVVIGAYLASIAIRQKKVDARLAEMDREN